MRSFLMFFEIIVYAVVTLPVAIYYGYIRKHPNYNKIPRFFNWMLQSEIRIAMAIQGIKFERTGEENIPEGACLFVMNHQGFADIPAILTQLGGLVTMIAKKEAKPIPVVHAWMRGFDCIYLDRKHPREGIKSIRKAQALLENGRQVIIFPEGTRSRGPQMNEFKAGAFKCAISAGVPIVPVAIDGSYRAKEESGHFKPASIKLSILKPVYPNEIEELHTKEIAEKFHDIIQDELSNMRK